MSRDIKISDEEVQEASQKLQHVETKKATASVTLVFTCKSCGAEQDPPVHCGVQMEFEETKFVCSECGAEQPALEHCGQTMAPKIKAAS